MGSVRKPGLLPRRHSTLDIYEFYLIPNEQTQGDLLQSVVADLRQYPEKDDTHPADARNQVTIGDLHANTFKLIRFLMRRNVLEMSRADYVKLYGIFLLADQGKATKEDFQCFRAILGNATYLSVGTVRLIGDEVADRVGNDYLLLLLLELLSKHNISIEILLSNHGVEFIEAYETGRKFNENRLGPLQANSSLNLQKLIDGRIVTREQVLLLVDSYYKPFMRCLSYTMNEAGTKISIFSHAAIGLNTIRAIAHKLNISYADATAQDLAKTIDSINEQFAIHVKANTVHTLYTAQHMRVMPTLPTGKDDQMAAPFEFLMWNRNYNDIERPADYNSYHIDFIHGHDSNEHSHHHIYNLDNQLGKAITLRGGTHNLYVNQDLPAKKPTTWAPIPPTIATTSAAPISAASTITSTPAAPILVAESAPAARKAATTPASPAQAAPTVASTPVAAASAASTITSAPAAPVPAAESALVAPKAATTPASPAQAAPTVASTPVAAASAASTITSAPAAPIPAAESTPAALKAATTPETLAKAATAPAAPTAASTPVEAAPAASAITGEQAALVLAAESAPAGPKVASTPAAELPVASLTPPAKTASSMLPIMFGALILTALVFAGLFTFGLAPSIVISVAGLTGFGALTSAVLGFGTIVLCSMLLGGGIGSAMGRICSRPSLPGKSPSMPGNNTANMLIALGGVEHDNGVDKVDGYTTNVDKTTRAMDEEKKLSEKAPESNVSNTFKNSQ